MNLHILGATSPIASYLVDQLNDDSEYSCRVFLYGRKRLKNVLALDDLRKTVLGDDVIISLIPISDAANLVCTLLEGSSLPKYIIALSSSSVYSKVYALSDDFANYLSFAIGELRLHEVIDQYKATIQLCILRPTMIWGENRDKNISKIVQFVNLTGFYPVYKRGQGKRSPIHFEELAAVIVSVLKLNLHGTYLVRTSNELEFNQILDAVMKLTARERPFFVRIPSPMARTVRMLCRLINNSSVTLAVNSLIRQGDDLVDFPEAKNVIIHDSSSLTFYDRLYNTYASSRSQA
jgi:nucleoside-diphosphate-sugar epimerase